MRQTTGSQLASLIQSAVEALAERGFDPRKAPLDLPADAPATPLPACTPYEPFAALAPAGSVTPAEAICATAAGGSG